jgi:hypothetical protein
MSEKMMSLNFKNLDHFVANSENAVMMEMNDEGAREGKEHRLDVIVALGCCGPLHDQCQNVNQHNMMHMMMVIFALMPHGRFSSDPHRKTQLLFSLSGLGHSHSVMQPMQPRFASREPSKKIQIASM